MYLAMIHWARMPRGTLIRKIHRQPMNSMISPPRDGPRANPMATVAPIRPMARPRREGGASSVTMAMPRAWLMAAPTPCRARKKISQPTLGARPQSRDARVNSPSPRLKIFFFPRMSPRRETNSRREATTST
jgi:hypothetical protein